MAPLRHHAAAFAALALLVTSAVASSCSTDEDCNLNGVCKNGACDCVSFWGGADCGVVQFKPVSAQTHGALLPVAGASHWCAGALSDGNGTWHLYSALMARHCGLSTWQSNSVITHATAAAPEGPYFAEEGVLGWFAHNPKPARAPDGSWLVFHIGCGGDAGTPRNCTNGTTPRSAAAASDPAAPPPNCSAYGTSVLSAPTPSGPWTDQTVIWPGAKPFPASVDNPSPLIFPNGSTWVMFRSYNGTGADRSVIGMARAPSWRGPYTIDPEPIMPQVGVLVESFNVMMRKSPLPPHSNSRTRSCGGSPRRRLSMPSFTRWAAAGAWFVGPLFLVQVLAALEKCADRHPRIRLTSRAREYIYSDVGCHAYSRDGYSWTASSTPAYGFAILFDDGRNVTMHNRERPQLLFDPVSGVPTHLINGVKPPAQVGRNREPGLVHSAHTATPRSDLASLIAGPERGNGRSYVQHRGAYEEG